MSDNLSFQQTLDNQTNKVASIMAALAQVDAALSDELDVNLASADGTVTLVQIQRCMSIATSGNAVARTLTLPAVKKLTAIRNGGTHSLNVVCGTSSLSIAAGSVSLAQQDGTANGLWAFGTGTLALSSLSDVDTTTTAPTTGQRLAWNGSKWVPATDSNTLSVSAETASYTAVLTDANTLVQMNSATAVTITIPPNSSVAFPIGTQLTVSQLGAGQVTIAAGAGVTLNFPSDVHATTRKQYSTITAIQTASNTWLLAGDFG